MLPPISGIGDCYPSLGPDYSRGTVVVDDGWDVYSLCNDGGAVGVFISAGDDGVGPPYDWPLAGAGSAGDEYPFPPEPGDVADTYNHVGSVRVDYPVYGLFGGDYSVGVP